MVCSKCLSQESKKWYSGPICYSCWQKAYFKANRQKVNALRRDWISKNPTQDKSYKKQFQTSHRDKYLKIQKHNEAKRRAIKRAALPKWADIDSIKQIYANCPDGYHVDHIIPLVSDKVCGLHVPWNLQYLAASDNLKKSNKF